MEEGCHTGLALLGVLQHPRLLLSFPARPSPLRKGLMLCAAVWSHFPTMAPNSLLGKRICISCGFNSSTSHRARHRSTVKHMNTSLIIYGPAWELRGFWMVLSGSASKINIIPSGFELIALFEGFFPRGKRRICTLILCWYLLLLKNVAELSHEEKE